MESNYYTPTINEFFFGFECEIMSSYGWQKGTFPSLLQLDTLTALQADRDMLKATSQASIRVKYLDAEDLESLGFSVTSKEFPSSDTFYKILPDNTVYQISPYWSMRRDIRETLVRIFKGELHQYPYDEIFRGDIKNKSELVKLMKQLNIQ